MFTILNLNMKRFNMRKHYTAEFKAKVALEAIKGNKTVGQIASEYEIHSARVSEWKSELLEKAKGLFEPHQVAKDHTFAEKEASLYRPCSPFRSVFLGNTSLFPTP